MGVRRGAEELALGPGLISSPESMILSSGIILSRFGLGVSDCLPRELAFNKCLESSKPGIGSDCPRSGFSFTPSCAVGKWDGSGVIDDEKEE